MRSTATVTAKTKTLILDFSRAYPDAGFLEMLPGASVLDLSSLEGTVCYCDPGSFSTTIPTTRPPSSRAC